MYWELCTGEFTGGGTLLSGAAVRKPCVQPPPLLGKTLLQLSPCAWLPVQFRVLTSEEVGPEKTEVV